MVMHTGDREIIAEIREREQARQEYEEARELGQTASLLEQERSNVFKMNVANILPGDSIAVRLSYTELLVPTEKQYEFVLPTVVGPRYSPEAVNEILGPDGGERIPHLHEGEDPNYTYAIEMTLAARPAHPSLRLPPPNEVIVEKDTSDELRLTLDPAGGFGGNRDFILRYHTSRPTGRVGPAVIRGRRGEFLFANGAAARPSRAEPDPAARVHFFGRCIRLHEGFSPSLYQRE